MYKKKQKGDMKQNKPKRNNAKILQLQMCYISINISSILLVLKIRQKVQDTFHANSAPAEFPQIFLKISQDKISKYKGKGKHRRKKGKRNQKEKDRRQRTKEKTNGMK